VAVGSTLAAARQARGLLVEDLCAVTRIRPHLIRAIEAEDYAACGGDVYVRGHVRALAKATGVDPEPLLAELPGSGGAGPAPMRAPAADPSLVLRERRVTSGWTTAFAVLLGMVACVAALRLVLPGGGGGSGAPTASRAAAPQASSSASGTSRSTPPTRTSGSGALSVSFAVTGTRCWLGVKDSHGATRMASVLSQGQTATFRDGRRLSIVVGNVSAVTVTVNGHRVSLPDAPGGVKRFVVKANDPLAAFGEPRTGAGGSASPAA
jgi:cytoskeleton protein RodZ